VTENRETLLAYGVALVLNVLLVLGLTSVMH
jgi:hypothetical protein